MSLRLGDGDLLVTPSSRSLGTIETGDLVRTDSQGVPREGQGRPTSELPLHLAAYRTRPEIACVVHTHPTSCVVWSKTGGVFPRDTVGASESLRDVAWTPYEKNGTQALADICAAAFARGADIVLMERHGVSVVSTDLEDAFMQTDLAEEAARIALLSLCLPDIGAKSQGANAFT